LKNDVATLQASVTKAISSVSGVSAVKVSLADKEATVTYDPKKTNLNAIKAAIVDAGYRHKPVRAKKPRIEQSNTTSDILMKETIGIFGMTCMHCHKRVTDAIYKVNGVKSVDVSLEIKAQQ